MKRIQGSDIAVTKDDQANINNFSRLYSKNQDNEGVLASLSEKISQHKDTLDELQLNDDEDLVRYRFGMCFFTLTTQKARALVQKDISRLELEKTNLDKQLEANIKKIKKLKSTLYAKFGNSINLDQ